MFSLTFQRGAETKTENYTTSTEALNRGIELCNQEGDRVSIVQLSSNKEVIRLYWNTELRWFWSPEVK